MSDVLSREARSRNMRAIRSEGTRAERAVRRLVHALGARYRLHRHDLPGTPDLALASRRLAIFVHGCFWHRHDCANGRASPSTRRDFLRAKFVANLDRDRRARRQLERLGWRVLVVWECELAVRKLAATRERLAKALAAS